LNRDSFALLERLRAEFHGKPQQLAMVEAAVTNVDTGIATLAALGHSFHLALGPAPPQDEYPKLVFHVKSAPNGRLVRSRWELADLGEDWYPSLEAAQHADGVRAQFAGRGGVGNRNLPVVIVEGKT
jgi:hypothetical protein